MSAQESLIPETIGDILRRNRLERSWSHADVSEELHIQTDFVKAIEDLNSDALPSIGYVLGYVRAYAELVGLNGPEAVAQYKIDSAVPENLGMRDRPHFVPTRDFRLPRGFFAATTVMSCAAVLAFWYGSNTAVQSANFTAAGTDVAVVDTAVEAVPVSDSLLTLKAVAPSWVEIKDAEGRVLISRIFVPGDSWQTDLTDTVLLSARDAGAFEIVIGSTSHGKIGAKGEPVFDHVLTRAVETPVSAN